MNGSEFYTTYDKAIGHVRKILKDEQPHTIQIVKRVMIIDDKEEIVWVINNENSNNNNT